MLTPGCGDHGGEGGLPADRLRQRLRQRARDRGGAAGALQGGRGHQGGALHTGGLKAVMTLGLHIRA